MVRGREMLGDTVVVLVAKAIKADRHIQHTLVAGEEEQVAAVVAILEVTPVAVAVVV